MGEQRKNIIKQVTINQWFIVIDTESRVESFLHEMVGYITGIREDCLEADDYADYAHEELDPVILEWFKNHILPAQVSDEYIVPCVAIETPGWFSDSIGNFYRDDHPEEEVLQVYLDHCLEKSRGRYSMRHQRALKEGVEKSPAFLSICIEINKVPNKSLLGTILERARIFAEDIWGDINVTGVRLLKLETISTTLQLGKVT